MRIVDDAAKKKNVTVLALFRMFEKATGSDAPFADGDAAYQHYRQNGEMLFGQYERRMANWCLDILVPRKEASRA